MLFSDPVVADQYEQVFESVFNDMNGYVKTPLASQWFSFPKQGGGVPNFQVNFAPHPSPPVSMATVAQALQNAKSSVMFAVMELGGSGSVLQTLQKAHLSGKVFSYGMTQSDAGFTVYAPGQPGVLVPFAALIKQVPPPFDKEVTGGAGQVIHDKFIVIDFNDANPVVFTGSSNLADGGETSNGDNMLAFYDPVVARVFATEAIRLVEHYNFRAAVSKATAVKPLMLTACGGQPKWWQPHYNANDMRNVQRLLFADGPSSVSSIPSGVSVPAVTSPAPTTTATVPAAKKTPAKAATKAPAKTVAKSNPVAKAKAPTRGKAKPKAKPPKKAVKPAKKKTAVKKRAPAKKSTRATAKPKSKTAAKSKRPATKAAKKTIRRK